MLSSDSLFLSLIAGVIPALLWLFFWLREDSQKPEPRGTLILTFICGMLAVPIVIPFEQLTSFATHPIFTFIAWAAIEELFKLTAAWFAGLRTKDDDEPIDPVIYMMTAALGFVALENTLYFLSPLLHGDFASSLLTGDIRFVGASLLHTVSSATIGIMIGFSFYKSRLAKQFSVVAGIVVAIALHATFNYFIIQQAASTTLATLGFVWIAVVLLMLFFERIKKVYPVDSIT